MTDKLNMIFFITATTTTVLQNKQTKPLSCITVMHAQVCFIVGQQMNV